MIVALCKKFKSKVLPAISTVAMHACDWIIQPIWGGGNGGFVGEFAMRVWKFWCQGDGIFDGAAVTSASQWWNVCHFGWCGGFLATVD